MFITWSVLQLATPSRCCPWTPSGASWSQAGEAGAGRAELPSAPGTWWSVLATWSRREDALAAAPLDQPGVAEAWHAVLAPASFRGDAALAGGARPFASLPARGRVTGAAAVITLAGFGPDAERTGEFLERFVHLGQDVRSAPGQRVALVQAPPDGAVLTFSGWESLRAAVTWAYHRPEHAATVRRQEEHGLLAHTGFLRAAVLGTSGTLLGADPMAGLTGEVVAPDAEEAR